MPDSTLNHTPAGGPYLDGQNYLKATPTYTEELADKLENADADVAAAINAAASAQAAAATVESIAGALTDPKKIRIGGVLYGRWGSVTFTPTSWAQQNSPWIFVATVAIPRPYVAPAGWRFVLVSAHSGAYAFVSQGPDSGASLQARVLQIGSSSFLPITCTWMLVPA